MMVEVVVAVRSFLRAAAATTAAAARGKESGLRGYEARGESGCCRNGNGKIVRTLSEVRSSSSKTKKEEKLLRAKGCTSVVGPGVSSLLTFFPSMIPSCLVSNRAGSSLLLLPRLPCMSRTLSTLSLHYICIHTYIHIHNVHICIYVQISRRSSLRR